MNQVLHIFRKDTRHFWPEILATLLILYLFVLHYPIHWRPFNDAARNLEVNQIAMFLMGLVPLSWWLLIGRLVQAESLVGDNQFWPTRPYDWKKLLAAKALFLGVWLYLPVFAAEWILVSSAGFAPSAYLGGLFFDLFYLSGILVLPLVAAAAVTGTFVRMTLCLVGAMFAGVAFLFGVGHRTAYMSSVAYANHTYFLEILVAFCLAAIALQYATRRLWASRGVLLAIFAAGPISMLALLAYGDRAVEKEYTASGTIPMRLAYAPDQSPRVEMEAAAHGSKVYLDLPIQVSEIAAGHALQVDNVKVSVEASGGFHWESPWQSTAGMRYLPGTQAGHLPMAVDRVVYDRMRAEAVRLQLTLAVTDLAAGKEVRVTAERGDFAVPDFGVCSTRTLYRQHDLACRSAVQQPPLTYIATTWSAQPCSGPQPDAASAPQHNGWAGTFDPNRVMFGPIAVSNTLLQLRTVDGGGGLAKLHDPGICPGTPVTFTQYRPVAFTRAELTVPQFRLPAEP